MSASMVRTTPPAVPDLLGTSPADLIDRVAEPPAATPEQARQRAERLRAGIVRYSEMRQDIADAYACKDWLALGYGSWYAYVEGEFGKELRELSRSDRLTAVGDLRQQGMSTRQIGAATGVSQKQVRNDLAEMSTKYSPVTAVTGADGKTYSATRPVAEPMPARSTSSGQSLPSMPVAKPELERPKPPPWDPEERRQHEEEVARKRDIEAAQRTAQTIVTEVRSLVLTVVAGCRYGERGLVTRDMIHDLRKSIDLLEGEIGEQ